jgi:hypothetical protein
MDGPPRMRWPQYSRVRFLTDAFAPEGASLGCIGYIVEVYDDAYEVEVSREDGSTQFLGAVSDLHLEPIAE